MSTWDVIFWSDCVDYVPSSWGNSEKTMYVWPAHITNTTRIRQMIDACKSPSLNGKWTECSATYKKTVDDIEEAERLCQKLQVNSTVTEESGDEDIPESIRKESDSQNFSSCHDNVSENSSLSEQNSVAQDIGLRKILEYLEEIKQQQVHLKRDVHAVKGLLEKLIAGDPKLASLAKTKSFELPVKDEKDVVALEEALADTAKIKALAHELSLVVGENEHKSVLFIMKKLFTKEVSLLYSSKGRKGKKNFSELKMCSAVIDAVRIRFPNATEVNIMKDIGLVLASAADRDGGRKKRNPADS